MTSSLIELSVSQGPEDGLYDVQVVRSGSGECSGTMRLDAASVLHRREQLQQALIASAAETRRLVPHAERALRETGLELFHALLGQAGVLSCYRASAALAQERSEPLRVVLRLNTPELAALPWECMYDQARGGYLSRSEPLVRHVPVDRPSAPLPVHGPLRVLAIAASPRGLPALDVEREKEILEAALAGPVRRGAVELAWTQEATWAGVQDLLLSDEWHVVHFVGHGDFDVERDEGVLVLVREDGRQNTVGASRFVDLLREARPMPRLVVLNSCVSGATGEHDLFAGTAAALVRGGVSAVAAMQFAVTDSAAIAFARGFYAAVAAGRGVDEALRSGRVGILGLSEQTLEWVTPVLYLRGHDAHLFQIDGTARDGSRGSSRAGAVAEAVPQEDVRPAVQDAPPHVDQQGRSRPTLEGEGAVSTARSRAPRRGAAAAVSKASAPADAPAATPSASAGGPAPPSAPARKTSVARAAGPPRQADAAEERAPRPRTGTRQGRGRAGSTPVERYVLAALRKFGGNVYLTPDIPKRKLLNARRACQAPDEEEVLGLVDCTVFGSAKHCLLFTRHGLLHAYAGDRHALAYSDFPGRRFGHTTVSLSVDRVTWSLAGTSAPVPALHKLLLDIQQHVSTTTKP